MSFKSDKNANEGSFCCCIPLNEMASYMSVFTPLTLIDACALQVCSKVNWYFRLFSRGWAYKRPNNSSVLTRVDRLRTEHKENIRLSPHWFTNNFIQLMQILTPELIRTCLYDCPNWCVFISGWKTDAMFYQPPTSVLLVCISDVEP